MNFNNLGIYKRISKKINYLKGASINEKFSILNSESPIFINNRKIHNLFYLLKY